MPVVTQGNHELSRSFRSLEGLVAAYRQDGWHGRLELGVIAATHSSTATHFPDGQLTLPETDFLVERD